MNFKKLADQAKGAIDKRGGTEALKRDFKEVAQSKGTFKDKAKAAGDKLKQPGRPGPGTHGTGHGADTPPTARDLPPRG
jgi:hypothetical protein